ncbi:hypothetical protein DY000_02052221 [Brassica cretica]|uniref:Uncharacterized protein n=1 Tax=Brassica cretica TaxID=69181 RepID=A0ABQ7A557_BRACR|nr:hypothetical protein DY000_02052221 [Brassica cretica]
MSCVSIDSSSPISTDSRFRWSSQVHTYEYEKQQGNKALTSRATGFGTRHLQAAIGNIEIQASIDTVQPTSIDTIQPVSEKTVHHGTVHLGTIHSGTVYINTVHPPWIDTVHLMSLDTVHFSSILGTEIRTVDFRLN